MGITHLQPIGARRVFPCLDEPEFKAYFNLKINHHKKFSAVSNTRVKEETMPDQESRVTTTFETTPKMSPYLLAFVISDFSVISKNNHSVYARPNAIDKGKFALEIEDGIFKNLEELTSIPFEINKIDLIAVPHLQVDAMENWGAIIFE